ncbi:MAG: hypothetical protein K2W97_08955 [Chthoniobacterales bacterium]|nr:hypothetical protein [Chthoniobacterales bacterium]
MNKNHRGNMDLFMSVAALGFIFFSSMEKLEAQAEVSSCALIAAPTKIASDKKFSLELIPLEGNHVNSAKCQVMDAQSIHLLPGQKLVVTLNKKWLFYQQAGKGTLGTNYNVQSEIKVDDWDGWENWVLDCTPLKCTGSSFNNFYNIYSYQAGNDSGKATLSLISQTYPRYYSSLQVIID